MSPTQEAGFIVPAGTVRPDRPEHRHFFDDPEHQNRTITTKKRWVIEHLRAIPAGQERLNYFIESFNELSNFGRLFTHDTTFGNPLESDLNFTVSTSDEVMLLFGPNSTEGAKVVIAALIAKHGLNNFINKVAFRVAATEVDLDGSYFRTMVINRSLISAFSYITTLLTFNDFQSIHADSYLHLRGMTVYGILYDQFDLSTEEGRSNRDILKPRAFYDSYRYQMYKYLDIDEQKEFQADSNRLQVLKKFGTTVFAHYLEGLSRKDDESVAITSQPLAQSAARAVGANPRRLFPYTDSVKVTSMGRDVKHPDADSLSLEQYSIQHNKLIAALRTLVGGYSDNQVDLTLVKKVFSKGKILQFYGFLGAYLGGIDHNEPNTQELQYLADQMHALFDTSVLAALFGSSFTQLPAIEQICVVFYAGFVSNGYMYKETRSAVKQVETKLLPVLQNHHDVAIRPAINTKPVKKKVSLESISEDSYRVAKNEALATYQNLTLETGLLPTDSALYAERIETELQTLSTYLGMPIEKMRKHILEGPAPEKKLESIKNLHTVLNRIVTILVVLSLLGTAIYKPEQQHFLTGLLAGASFIFLGLNEYLKKRNMKILHAQISTDFSGQRQILAREIKSQLSASIFINTENTKHRIKKFSFVNHAAATLLLLGTLASGMELLPERNAISEMLKDALAWMIPDLEGEAALKPPPDNVIDLRQQPPEQARNGSNQTEQQPTPKEPTPQQNDLGEPPPPPETVSNQEKAPEPGEATFATYGVTENIFWSDRSCELLPHSAAIFCNYVEVEPNLNLQRFNSKTELHTAVLAAAKNGKIVRINSDKEDMQYGIPFGYKPVEILSTNSGPIRSLHQDPVALTVQHSRSDVVAVVYEKIHPAVVFESFSVPPRTDDLTPNTEWQQLPEHIRTILTHAQAAVHLGASHGAVLSFLKSEISKQGISYGFAEYSSNAATPLEEVTELLQLSDGKPVHPEQICNQFAYTVYVLAREIGLDVHLVTGVNQDASNSHAGFATQQHMLVAYRTEAGHLDLFEATLPSIDPNFSLAAGEAGSDFLAEQIAKDAERALLIKGLAGLLAVLLTGAAGAEAAFKLKKRSRQDLFAAQNELAKVLGTASDSALKTIWYLITTITGNGEIFPGSSYRIPINEGWYDFTAFRDKRIPSEENALRVARNLIDNYIYTDEKTTDHSSKRSFITRLFEDVNSSTYMLNHQSRKKFWASAFRNFFTKKLPHEASKDQLHHSLQLIADAFPQAIAQLHVERTIEVRESAMSQAKTTIFRMYHSQLKINPTTSEAQKAAEVSRVLRELEEQKATEIAEIARAIEAQKTAHDTAVTAEVQDILKLLLSLTKQRI